MWKAESCLAVVRRLFKEDEIFVAGSFEASVGGYEGRALSVELDPWRSVIALFQTVPSLSERRQLMPACLDVTWSTHTVTLALGLRVTIHRLPVTRTKNQSKVWTFSSLVRTLLIVYLIVMGCLHDPANVQQASSICNAGRLLEVCWTFAGSCKHPIRI